MPQRSLRPCSYPGCPALVRGSSRCPAHQQSKQLEDRERRALTDAKRPSAAARGYDAGWARYRKWFLRQPENVLCACGCGRPSEEVDHIIPVSGPEDPLFWQGSNHQGLTRACHAAKTQQDRAKGLTK